MPTTLTFTCKDPLITAFYEDRFGEAFARDAQAMESYDGDEGEAIWAHLKKDWEQAMLAEARVQEHYDYDVVDMKRDGRIGTRRQIIVDENSQPKLLIPEITVELG
jgi:hypothetical protein